MPVDGRARSRLLGPRVLDPVAAGLVAIAVYALHGFSNTLDRDPATFIYGGQQFANGIPPYRGIFNSVGPLGDMTAGVGILLGRLVGLDDVTGARLIFLVLSGACVAGVSVLAREAFGSRAVGVLAPAVFLTFSGFIHYATAGPREKTVMVLCLEVALLALLRDRWFVAGVFTALAALTWQPAILPLVVSAGVAIVISAAPWLRAVAAYVVGGVVPTLLLTGYFALEGALKLSWWGFVRVNVGYTTQPTIVDTWGILRTSYGWSLFVVVLGCGLAVALALRSLVRRGPVDVRAHTGRARLVLGSGALVAAAWSCYAINGPGDLFVVLPFAALGVAAVLAERALWTAVVALALVGAGVESSTTRDTSLPSERQNVTRMVSAVPPGSTVLSFYAPEVLVLAHRRNPDPWQLTDEAKAAFLDDHLPGGLSGYAERISRSRPALIVIGVQSTTDWLRPVLRREYARVGRGQHWTWYASKTLGPPTLQRLREVNRETAGK